MEGRQAAEIACNWGEVRPEKTWPRLSDESKLFRLWYAKLCLLFWVKLTLYPAIFYTSCCDVGPISRYLVAIQFMVLRECVTLLLL